MEPTCSFDSSGAVNVGFIYYKASLILWAQFADMMHDCYLEYEIEEIEPIHCFIISPVSAIDISNFVRELRLSSSRACLTDTELTRAKIGYGECLRETKYHNMKNISHKNDNTSSRLIWLGS